jgi:hypothetical protein
MPASTIMAGVIMTRTTSGTPGGWWFEHHPDWVRGHHPDWAKQGDWDDHHHWHERGWWKEHDAKWTHKHHPDWF